jgi:hypothetical protein
MATSEDRETARNSRGMPLADESTASVVAIPIPYARAKRQRHLTKLK